MYDGRDIEDAYLAQLQAEEDQRKFEEDQEDQKREEEARQKEDDDWQEEQARLREEEQDRLKEESRQKRQQEEEEEERQKKGQEEAYTYSPGPRSSAQSYHDHPKKTEEAPSPPKAKVDPKELERCDRLVGGLIVIMTLWFGWKPSSETPTSGAR
jgi:hypothetical protein